MKLRTLSLTTLAALALTVLPARADLASNLRHTPAQVDTLVSLSTSYEDWKYFLTRKPFNEIFAQIRKDVAPPFEKELGMSFERDILPMLGSHLNIAIYNKEQRVGDNIPALLVLDIKNKTGFPKLIGHLREVEAQSSDKSIKLEESSHRGVSVYGFLKTSTPEVAPYMALSGNTLLIGSKSLVFNAIDAGQGQIGSALSESSFKVAHDSLSSQKLWVYTNPRTLSETLNFNAESAESQADVEKARQSLQQSMEMYDSLGFGLDLNRNGLVFKSVVRTDPNSLSGDKQALMQSFQRVWNDPQAPLLRLLQGSPARPLMAVGFNGLQLMDQSVRLFNPALDEESKQLWNGMGKGFTDLTGLDFQQDLLKYSDGRGALAVFYPESAKIFDRPPHVVTYLGIKDSDSFQKILQQKLRLNLKGVMPVNKPAVSSEPVRFSSQPATTYQGSAIYLAAPSETVKRLQQSMYVQPAYSRVGDVWLFASNLNAIKSGIDQLKGKQSNLLSNPNFKQLTQRFNLQLNGGVFYMDLSAAMKLVEFLGGADPEVKQLKPTLNAFKSVLAGGRYVNNVAEGLMVVDIDMDKVDFELLAKVFGMLGGSELTKNQQSHYQPGKKPPSQPGKKPPKGATALTPQDTRTGPPVKLPVQHTSGL